MLSAERAFRNNPRTRHRLNWRRNVLTTLLANDYERIEARCWGVKHAISIGEQEAKISTSYASIYGFAEGSISVPEGSKTHFCRPTVLFVFN